VRHFDLAVIGTGSGNTLVTKRMNEWSVAILERGTFSGTCLNVGCIPTKMFEYTAELAQGTTDAARFGVDATLDKVHWAQIRDRIFGRIDPISASGREYRLGPRTPNVTLYEGTARFVGPKTLDTGTGETVTADRIVIAAGSRPVIPPIPGLVTVEYHTSDTVMRLDELPPRIVIVGGGYIAAEFGHIFASLGSTVSQLSRGPRLLKHQDREVSDTFTSAVGQRYDVRLSTKACGVSRDERGIVVEVEGPDGRGEVIADVLLLATGRTPNTDLLDPAAGGVDLHPDGRVKVDEFQRTNVDGVFALGDISSDWQLKHVANAEARTVAYNLLHPQDLVATDHRFVPSAVFAWPQIATVGLSEEQAQERGVAYVVGKRDYAGVAAGWAREEPVGFAKVLADPDTGRLLGAHVIGPEAATVIQPAIQALSFGQTVRELTRGQYWIHPALPEVLENALIEAEHA